MGQIDRTSDRLGILSSYEDIHAEKEPIAIKDLFKPQAGKQVKRIMVWGRAGIGKSTLCQFVTNQWAKGKLWKDKFDLLIWLPLRDLNELNYPYMKEKEYSLKDVIKKEYASIYLSSGEIPADNICKYIRENSGRILFLLDGYDETAQIPAHLQPLLESLTGISENMILTSRPTNISGVNFDIKVEDIGFTDQEIPNYVNQFFANLETPEKTAPLINFLNHNANIKGISHIPINLELICSLWDSRLELSEGKEKETKRKLIKTLKKY